MKSRKTKGYLSQLTLLKKLFWLYFLLLIFEGALRKWVAPQLSAPLLIIRDPVSLMIIWEAYRTGKWPSRGSTVIAILSVAFVGLFVLQIVVGDNPWFVGIYGLRSILLPFPVAFIIGENLNEEDLRRLGVCTMWILLPLTVLEVGQYIAPADSFLNRGAYAGGSQISYAGGHVRASGTFSFVSGPINFNSLAAAFIFYGLVKERLFSRWLLWAASFALILSVPVIGARSLVFELVGILGSVIIGAILGVSQFAKTLRIILPVLIMSFLVSLLPIFSDAVSTLGTRFSEATASEGGNAEQAFFDRTLGSIEHVFQETDFGRNWIGVGMGRGAAAMQTLLSGTREFATGEDELSRELIELGPFGGSAFMMFRYLLAGMIVFGALARAHAGESLGLLLVPLTITGLVFGVLEQPTGQGFIVIGLGFSLAAIKRKNMGIKLTQVQRIPSRLPSQSKRA